MIRKTADPTANHATATSAATHGSGQVLDLIAALPAAPVPALAEAIAGRRVVAHAEFDLDESLRYARRFIVLLEGSAPRAAEASAAVVYTRADGSAVELAVARCTEAKLDEALGVDRLIITECEGKRHELPFSRRYRLEMSRFHQRLQRRIEHDEGHDLHIPTGEDDEPEDESEFDKPKRKVLARLLEVAKPYRGRIYIALALTVASAVLNVLPAFLTKFVIDEAINPLTTVGLSAQERASALLFWCSAYALAAFAMFASYWGRLKTLSYVGSHVAGDLRDRVYRHLHSLSMRYFGKHRVGSLITRVTSDTDRLWDFIVFGSVDFIKNILMMFVAAGFMFWANWQLAMIALIPLPFVATLTWWKSAVMTRLFSRLWTYWSRLTAVVGDALPGVKVVKAFASEARETARFARRNKEYTDDEYAAVRVWVNLQPVVEGTMMISRVIILVVGGWFIISAGDQPGNTFGTLVMFLTVVGFFHVAIQDLAQKQRMVTRAATSAQRVFEVLDTKPEITSKPAALSPAKIEGRVEFRDVSFSYDGTKPILRHVSLKVEPGQMVGLCGHSGAGKSTFVNLISRFYDVSDGSLMIDGVDVRDYDLGWLRSHVGVVLQDPYLFYGTIADNIRYGKPEASLAEVIESARAANAHDFIVALPDGYDTLVGERGQSLSGGERQRVSIARAILHNPKVLVLDEATSSVDTKTERQIQEALDRLMEGRTTFAIAHRLSTLRNADLIVVLDQGRIVETGTHEQLLAESEASTDGHYAKLYKAQADIAADMLVEA